MKKITITEWLNRYENTSAAKKTALVYTLEKRVYMSLVDSLEGLPVTIFARVDNSGNEYDILRLDLKQIDLLRLRDKGAALLGWAKDIFPKERHNKGEIIERLVIERYNGKPAKVGTPYYEAGDAIIAGIETQIKYSDGTLARIDTIRNQWNKQKKKKG